MEFSISSLVDLDVNVKKTEKPTAGRKEES